MGAAYQLRCNKCGHAVSTSGPWEFYRDAQGQVKDYGHPVPCSKEAKQCGIAGLRASLYCPDCDKVSEVVIVEFKEPSRQALDVWSGRAEPKDEYMREEGVRCPACQGSRLVLAPEDGQTVACPRCRSGAMVASMEWIS